MKELLAVFSFAFILVSAEPATAYENHKFGFSVFVPNNMTACKEQPPAPDDGIAILYLGSKCKNLTTSTHVSVWSEYNVIYDAQDVDVILNKICHSSVRQQIKTNDVLFEGCPEASAKQSTKFVYLRRLPNQPTFDYVLYYVQIVNGNGTIKDDNMVQDVLRNFKLMNMPD